LDIDHTSQIFAKKPVNVIAPQRQSLRLLAREQDRMMSAIRQTAQSRITSERPSRNYHRGSHADNIFAPFLIEAIFNVLGDFKIKPTIGFARRNLQQHSRFFGGSVAFLDVAAYAGGDNVFPGISPTPRSRDYMIQGEILSRIVTVLASVAIPV
jgi:hypothetical protein